jgi:hypothetical protein
VGSRFAVCVFRKSRYLYNFHIFIGKFSEAGSRDGTSDYRFVFDLMMNKLIPESFNHTGKAGFSDNYFTYISVFRSLLERGIFMTGPSKAVRPKKDGNKKENSWPFQAYKKTEMLLVGGKGWMMHCFRKSKEQHAQLFAICMQQFGLTTCFGECPPLPIIIKWGLLRLR